MEDGKTVAFAYAESDGTFEIRSSNAGRFTLLGSAADFCRLLGWTSMGELTDVFEQDVMLATNTVRQEVTVTATGIPTPLPQLTSPVT